MTTLLDRVKPWLIEFGSWIFGGLIAFNLIIVAPLLTIRRLWRMDLPATLRVVE